MRKIAALILFVSMAAAAWAQCGGEKPIEMGKSAGEDVRVIDNGPLFFVFLNRPANAPTYSKEEMEKIQQGHLANIGRLVSAGKIVMAGPLLEDSKVRGIFVFRAASMDEVKELLKTDPAVQAGRLEGDVHPWKPFFGEIHDARKLPENYEMGTMAMVVYRWGDKSNLSPADQRAAWDGHKKYQLDKFQDKTSEIGGPFDDAMANHAKGGILGVVIANGKKPEGEKLAADDPAVKAGLVVPEVHEWATAKGILYH